MKSRSFNLLVIFALCLSLLGSALTVTPAYAATFTVNSTSDTVDANPGNGTCTDAGGNCSLRAAIDEANALAGADTITLPAGTYNLNIVGAAEDLNATGDLDITDPAGLTINGAGESSTTIRQTTGDRVFELIAGNFTLSNVTITGGNVSGNGGGVYLNTNVTLTIDSVTFSGNSASSGLGGGGLYAGDGTVNISKSTFSNNSTSGNADGGGAIMFRFDGGAADATIADSTFSGNTAYDAFGSGGAIHASANSLKITGSTFSNNQALATNNNFGGGALYVLNTPSVVANSTFSGNSANMDGGGILYRNDDTFDMTNVTIASNTADGDNNGTGDGGGFFTASPFGIDNAAIGNTIIAGNSDSGGQAPDCGGYAINSQGYNLIQSLTGCTFTVGSILIGNITGQSALLAALADNGGPTQTRALQAGSPAIDKGDNTMCANAPVSGKDQRGINRPQPAGGVCDIGAYEYYVIPIVTASNPSANAVLTSLSSISVTFNQDMVGNASATGAQNVNNYMLVERGMNSVFDTLSCNGGLVSDDAKQTISTAVYNNAGGVYIAVLNLASPLAAGTYRLFVCGTTSIWSVAGFELNDGASDYTVDFTISSGTTAAASRPGKTDASSLPKTGFAPNRVTTLPPQPANLAYSKFGDLWLEIPSLNVKSTIVGVPQNADKTWSVDWLGNDTGWLNGTAFPTWTGNSVLTAHVTNADGLAGPFAALKSLKFGDQIIVHMGGGQYVYEVRNTRLARPYSTSYAFQSMQDASYITLVTCSGYNPLNESYLFRRVVRAVLVEVKGE